MFRTYIDDNLRKMNETFKRFAKKTNTIFEKADEEELPCEVTGFSKS